MPAERPDVAAALQEIEQGRAERFGLARKIREAPAAARPRLREEIHATRVHEQAVKDRLRGALGAWLPEAPGDEVARLSARWPIALFPVRLETRFEGRSLKVRVYPDAILANLHEPLLTEAERTYGEAYWARIAAGMAEADSWSVLVRDMTPQRAAWVVQRTDPASATPPAVRPADWGRFPESRALPDRWIVVAHRDGKVVRRVAGRPIEQPLALAVRLAADADDGDAAEAVALSGDGLRVDRDLAWAFDYARAEEVGMAITVALDAIDLERGFDRLVVYGVKASIEPADGAARLRELLDAHHYTRGLAFVRQGTATNNTTGAPSGYPPADPDGRISFAVERGPAIAAGDGVELARALGLAPEVVAHVAGADLAEQRVARAMNAALWPVTFGYFVEQMMAPVADDAAAGWLHGWFVERVRGRGFYPAFRVGDVPYGLVPVSSLARWQPAPPRIDVTGAAAGAPAPERGLPRLLGTLRGIWAAAVPGVPRVGRGDPDEDLVQSLALDASAREVFLRKVLGRETQWNLFGLLGLPFDAWDAIQQSYARAAMAAVGHPEWEPRILGMSFADAAEQLTHHPQDRARPDAGLPLVDAPPLSDERGLAFDYVRWIGRDATFGALTGHALPGEVPRPRALLYHMLRHAMLEEYRRAGYRLLVGRELIARIELRERELHGVAPGRAKVPSVRERMAERFPDVTGDRTLAEYLDRAPASTLPPLQRLASYREALRDLEGLPTAELERLFGESLDVCSHRLDAWIGSLAADRLRAMRDGTPAGVHLAAYGWVEDLRPRRAGASPGGFVHAPSMNHAAAAAVLRSAYLTRTGLARRPYAIELSSRRVRLALELLDGVRQGQPIGAILGYRFERGLHEGHPGFELDRYIDDLRGLFPLVAHKGTPPAEVPADEPAETVAARNVVDGHALVTAFRAGTLPWGTPRLPAAGDDRREIEAELRHLDDALDAVADLLLSDSVYQLVSGATDAAGATLEALARGQRPPDPAIVRTPRRTTPFVQRVAIVLGGGPVSGGAFHDPVATARAAADPHLNAWVGTLLGDPSRVRCRVEYPDPLDPATTLAAAVTLAQLDVEPLDVLAMARAVGQGAADAELDRRIAWAIGAAITDASQVRITYAPVDIDPATERSFAEVLEIARAVNELLAASRPLGPTDLVPPDERAAASSADLLPAEMLARAGAALAEASAAIAQLDAALAIGPLEAIPEGATPDLAPLRAALRRASLLGVAGAFPRSRAGSSRAQLVELYTAAESVRRELAQRRDAALAEPDPAARLRAVLGRDLLALPRFVPAAAPGFADALATPPAFDGDDHTPARWMQQVARVRAHLARRRRVELYGRATGAPPAGLRVVQLPHVPGARWIAGKLAPAERPGYGRLSLVLDRVQAPAAGAPWVGLLVDEWVEDIPDRTDDTGIVFHFDSPGAEAPQAVLLAVPPAPAEAWDAGALEAVLDETLELAKLRAVDAERVGVLGQLLPAIYLADNPSQDTVATRFAGLTVAPGIRVERE
jgi:hypothetical protein